jgi:hypothetical protein
MGLDQYRTDLCRESRGHSPVHDEFHEIELLSRLKADDKVSC